MPAPPTSGTTAAPRPAILPLDDVRPCDLFTDAVRREFELRGAPESGTDTRGQPTCQMVTASLAGYLISASRSEGMERFEGISADRGTVRRLTVAGFPAAELRDVNVPYACLVGVDVADGQHLGVFVTGPPKGGTQDEICQNAAKFAEAVVASLRQQLGR